ncbi:MAG: ABC transporter ATP-binding protein [Propioniciclava sp.]
MKEPATVTEPLISVKDIGVEFHLGRRSQGLRDIIFRRPAQSRKSFWAVKDVSFDVHPGEAIGVIGRNGSGKSTLLKLVAGVMLPDQGFVSVRGGIAPLIEITGGFVPNLTGRENIYLAAGLHGMPKSVIDERFEGIVAFSEIGSFLDTPFKHLSSGMKVRLAFSVISELDAPILMVDEVLAVGDKAFRDKCFDRIERRLDQGHTLFLVSHSDKNLTRFCTRGLYMRKGDLRADAPIAEVLEQYHRETEV